LAEKLVLNGIEYAEHLKIIDAENAFIKLKTVDSDACYNMLCAVEGAIRGMR
jgi:DNA transformation protein